MRKTILFLFFLLFSKVTFSQVTPVSFDELRTLNRNQIKESISEGENISIIASEVLLAEFDSDKTDKILEISCILNKYDGSKVTYSTVHRQVFNATEDGAKLDQGFFILRDVSLRGVESMNFLFGVRSLNNEQSKLFNIVSNILINATSNNPAIETVKELINTQGEIEESIPLFDATFYIANNYINYRKAQNENVNIPYLTSVKDNNIVFEKISRNIPKNKLKRFANLVLRTELFEDRENIGGVLVLKASKAFPKPIEKPILDKLEVIFREFKKGEVDAVPELIENAYTTLDLVYSEEKDRSSSAYQNVVFYLSLANVYYNFVKTSEGDQQLQSKFYNMFYQWNVDKSYYSEIEDFSFVPIKEIYDRFSTDPDDIERIVNFYIPNNLPNDYIIQSFFMQHQMHINFNKSNQSERIRNITTRFKSKS